MFHSMLVWFFRACTLKKVACVCQECYDFTLKPQIIKMDVCLPVCKVGLSVCRRVRFANGVTYMFCGLQTETLSLQTGTVCK